MKKAIVITIFVLSYYIASAQFIVLDPGDIAATIVNGGILKKTNEVIKEANEIASDIKETVSNIRELQQTIDDALSIVKSIIKNDDLGISNIQFELEAAASISGNFGDFVNGIVEGDHPMIVGYGNANVSIGAEMLQHVFEYGIDDKLPNGLNNLYATSADQSFNKEVYAYGAAKKKIQIALTYNKLAEVMLVKADKLNSLLKKGIGPGIGKDEVLKMTEGERIQLLETSASYVRKALELRMLCDQIIQKEVERISPVRDQVMNMYDTYMRTRRLFATKEDDDG
ncbi:hypothetical protein [Tunicatimonas pelagia]|uniref:hypothetical protein n=1 Tax=Tunicatimonas pelagia TaxID=931531 RepID=UPI0026655A6C|nr:hypothetical protein [Tunicatimonas pelagia]WKN46482.1 hypothetical protein P0M28_30495 [Tunicatimonas pelagia]